MLHVAGKLEASKQVAGPALQMQREFEGVQGEFHPKQVYIKYI